MKTTIALVIMGMMMVSSLAMAGYTTTYINEDFSGTTLDTTVWHTYGNVSYQVADGYLKITYEDSNDSASVVSKPYTITDGALKGEMSFTIYTDSTQDDGNSMMIYVGAVFDEWNENFSGDSKIVGSMVGMGREGDAGGIYYGTRTGTTASEHIKYFEIGNGTSMFGKNINFRFVFYANKTGSEASVHALLYMDGIPADELYGHVYNITDKLSMGIMLEDETHPVTGIIKVDSAVVGKYTPEKKSIFPTFSVVMPMETFLAMILLASAILIYAGEKLKDKEFSADKLAKALVIISFLLFTYAEYITQRTFYGIPSWIIPVAILVLYILYIKGYLKRKSMF